MTQATGGTADSAVRVRGLRKRYGGKAAVDGIDLQVRRGEVFALLGPNGAGKTTTVEILEGYRSRDGGEVSVLGTDPARGDRAWRSRIGIVSQSESAPSELTVREMITHFSTYYPKARDPEEIIAAVGLQDQATSHSAWWAARNCCSSTSRRPASIRRPGGHSGTWSPGWPVTA